MGRLQGAPRKETGRCKERLSQPQWIWKASWEAFQGVWATSDIASKCGDNLLPKYRQPTEVDTKEATICENDNFLRWSGDKGTQKDATRRQDYPPWKASLDCAETIGKGSRQLQVPKIQPHWPLTLVPFDKEPILKNIKDACKSRFGTNSECDILAGERGPASCRSKVIHNRFLQYVQSQKAEEPVFVRPLHKSEPLSPRKCNGAATAVTKSSGIPRFSQMLRVGQLIEQANYVTLNRLEATQKITD